MNRKEQNTDLKIIQTKIEDYSKFMESLEEISSITELREISFLRELYAERALSAEITHLKVIDKEIGLDDLREDKLLADYLLVITLRTCNKIGDIASMVKQGLNFYSHEEDNILEQMECAEASNHFEDYMNPPEESREPDPCEVPDCEGNYTCPFDSNGTDDCRRHCGVGVDE